MFFSHFSTSEGRVSFTSPPPAVMSSVFPLSGCTTPILRITFPHPQASAFPRHVRNTISSGFLFPFSASCVFPCFWCVHMLVAMQGGHRWSEGVVKGHCFDQSASCWQNVPIWCHPGCVNRLITDYKRMNQSLWGQFRSFADSRLCPDCVSR